MAGAADVFEDQGVLWKQRPGGTSTFEELLEARAFFIETHQDALWNPWVTEDNEAELDAAMVIIREWTRAESHFRQWTADETDAYLDEGRRTRAAERTETEARWDRDKDRFDPELFAARRALLEQESLLVHFRSELEDYQSGRRFPAVALERREKEILDLTVKLARCEESIALLCETVVDP
ncbi:hypothetical protein [Microbacterium sp. 22296]|uniref:hypothetical protein n=1 Tax=Microbacterium sp. 22296 TaxID=3453903 RepID=UPI003F855FF4